MNKVQEILDILQEECGEVIQEVSKVRRFGIDSIHFKENMSHRVVLTNEIGDLQCMIDLAIEHGLVKKEDIDNAAKRKRAKLQSWSNIFKE